ncbi:hypothetical protein NE237_020316 [Protea cynaroides]|uniref:Disease resistance protein RPS4B/Roq1-like leucine-rich repeats domain-containing protein n=1 Tax=Protea cynaroides TaxID=273540 RepID=A0A9Q0K272_9MAGN|nr:hypothetical protein NE237_020316 [Protea cynaroides]
MTIVEVYEYASASNIGLTWNLVILELCYSKKIQQVWKGTKILSKLKILDLSFSSNLIRTPDFSGLPNLEKLLLYGCKRLVEVHENIDHLSKLVHLNLTSCVSLGNLPSGISKLVSLESLGICYCLKLEKLPAGIGNLTRLRSLDAFRTAIEELPSSINLLKDLTTFKYFVPSGQRNPKSIALLSASLYGWYSLNRLQLTNCHLMDVDIPDDLWKLCCLKSLDLSGNDFCSLPSGICDQLSELETLRLNYCKSLQSLPRLPSSLCFLEASNCISLERLPNLSNLKHLKKLKLSGCSKLKEIEALGSLESGEEIDLYYCDNLDKSRIFQEISKEFRNRDVCQISLSESEIPEWFEFQNEQPSSSASCQVTILHNMEIRGVIICIVLPSSDYDSHEVVVHNQSKNSTLNRLIFLDYIARPSGVFDEQLSVMKIPYCVWKSIAGFGDVINVSVRKTWGDELSVVNKIGVHLFHTQHEKVSNQGNSEAT